MANQIVAIDQKRREVLFFRQDVVDWDSEEAVVWKIPLSDWDNLSDVKLRTDANGVKVVLVISAGGKVASFKNGSTDPIWEAEVRGNTNLHAIELLRNGAVAVADSEGWVHYFPYGSEAPAHRYKLESAHGVLFSDNRLWALGRDELKQYDYSEKELKEAQPEINKGIDGGHDLATWYGTKNHGMWLTDAHHVYWFDKYDNTLIPHQVNGVANRECVKAMGNQRDGTIVQVHVPNCTPDFWWTDTVEILDRDGNNPQRRTRKGARFYKARPVIWTYY